MANYCDAEDVSVLMGLNVFDATSRPTLTQVNAIIADKTNEIDFVLSGVGITTQPTDSKILGRLALACKYGSASDVALSVYGNAAGVDGSQGEYFGRKYKEIIDEIKEMPELYGYITGDSNLTASNQVLDGTYTESEINDGYIDRDYKY